MEDEARNILRAALAHPTNARPMISSIRARVEALGGIDMELPERGSIRVPPKFEQ